MAMSRSFGGTSLTTSPPITMSPPVISSSPAIMRSVVDLAAARRADQHDEFLVGDVEIDAAHGRDFVVLLDDLAQRYLSHVSPHPFVAPAVRPAM